MSYQQEIFSLVADLGGSKNKIAISSTFCRVMGSLEGGMFLSQLLFWCDKGKDGEWFYKTYDEWNMETFLSEYQVRNLAKKCCKIGFLETKVAKANGNPTVHYRVDRLKFTDWFLKNLSFHSLISSVSIVKKLKEPYTEITTEITTEISSAAKNTADDASDFDDDEVPFSFSKEEDIAFHAEPSDDQDDGDTMRRDYVKLTPRPPTEQFPLMQAISKVILGHDNDKRWPEATRQQFGKLAKKFRANGVTPFQISTWYEQEWKPGYHGKKGERPGQKKFEDDFGAWLEQQAAVAEKPAYILVPSDDYDFLTKKVV